MKKIAKISLVAAIAVAGFTTANAQPLEEAIKNVDVSGSVVYRYNDSNNDAKNNGVPVTSNSSASTNNYKAALNLSSKVNDDVKANTRFLVSSADGDFASLNTQGGGDGNVNVTLSNVYFGYTGIKNTTVNVGKQGLTTPWTVATQADGNEQTGTGILALSTVGPVTLAGAFFNQTNLGTSGDVLPTLNSKTANSVTVKNSSGATIGTAALASTTNDDFGNLGVATVGAIVAVGPVTIDAWYLDMDTAFDTYTVGAKAANKLANIDFTAEARYASLKGDDADAERQSISKIVLTADAGLIDGKLAYAKTGKNGGLTALDKDASTTLLGWNLNALNKTDADYYQAVLGIDILSNLNLSANYGQLKYESDVDESTKAKETYAQLLYKMSKNLTTYVRYGILTDKTTDAAGDTTENKDSTVGRLQVAYTF